VSSHSVKLAQRLRDFQAIKDSHKDPKNEYSRGFYNGLELAWSLLSNKNPQYLSKEDKKSANAKSN